MISIIDSGKLVNTDNSPFLPREAVLVGLSSDEKPTGLDIGNGWMFIEMDTSKIYFFDAANSEWLEFGGEYDGGGSIPSD